jgi:hypothetical protein
MLIRLTYRLYRATPRFSVMGYRQERVLVLDWFGRTWEWRWPSRR